MTEKNNQALLEEDIQPPLSRMERYHKKERPEQPVTTANEPKNPPTPKAKTNTTQETMVQSTAWLTVGNLFSRLLGAVYIIPWYAWMYPHSVEANYLFSKGYNVYALFLMISTAGIPAAVAKQTARYNAMNEYGLSKQLLYYTVRIMLVAGFLCTLLMFFGAPLLSQGNPALVPVMRSLSIVLLIFPAMSVLRGFFQGNNEMKPYALSQIIEQIARVAYILITGFVVMRVLNGNYKTAVVHATFAAFIGVAFALAVLLLSLWKRRLVFQELEKESRNELTFSGRQLVIQMVRQAIPFIVIGSGISIFKLIDQYSFEKIMSVVTNFSAAKNAELFTLLSPNPDKLTMVVIAMGTSMATAGLPLITEKFNQRDHKGLSALASNNFQLFFFIMMPATIGMMVLAYPLNTLFYSPDPVGSKLLAANCLLGIMMGLFMVCSTMFQGLDGNRKAVVFLLVGILVKLIVQAPLIFIFHAYGPLLASFVGLLVSNLFILDQIHVITAFPLRATLKSISKIIGMALLMGLVALLVRFGVSLVLSSDSKFQSMIEILIVAAAGGLTYIVIALKTRIADQLLGAKVSRIRKLLHIS
ncbi:putative polysaccharide biosynthesis protein [Enterococcus sp. CSURQ0835]|uniref:putative polysaccharide biosynthesis protein n=1 Tax=Enterococcus sp. CSURQ0835 TaxID=2681394 RepID=UPI00135BCA66|nr:oligosaccharide flippase family protein [Enterococcus sp. CSURQ0835]